MQQVDTLKAAVIGWPVAHSLSPRLHGFWLKKYGVQGSYEALATPPDDFAAILLTLETGGFTGANITVPYKEQILGKINEVDEIARRIGAVNTIAYTDGRWRGTNTDAYGFMESLRAGSDVWRDGYALVLGAGGASRAICVGLLDEGFDVVLANRTREKAEAVQSHLSNPRLSVTDWCDVEARMKDANLVVNTTTLGMKGQELLTLSLETLPRAAYVADIVYNPQRTGRTKRFSNPCITDFLAKATENGNQVIDGLGMLLFQAQAGFELWFGVKPEVTRALRSHVLEGLPHGTQ